MKTLVLALFLAASVGCTVDTSGKEDLPAECSATCTDGCCNSAGQCVASTTDSCGLGGRVCVNCGSEAFCDTKGFCSTVVTDPGAPAGWCQTNGRACADGGM